MLRASPLIRETVGEPESWWPDPPDRAPGTAMRLDYCFVSTGLGSSVFRAWVDTDADGSDHKPYWVQLDDGDLTSPGS